MSRSMGADAPGSSKCPSGKKGFETRVEAQVAVSKRGQRTFLCGCGKWHVAVGGSVGSVMVDRV